MTCIVICVPDKSLGFGKLIPFWKLGNVHARAVFGVHKETDTYTHVRAYGLPGTYNVYAIIVDRFLRFETKSVREIWLETSNSRFSWTFLLRYKSIRIRQIKSKQFVTPIIIMFNSTQTYYYILYDLSVWIYDFN